MLVSLISYLVWTVPSDLLNLRYHQHGQSRKNKGHTRQITGTVDYFYRFLKLDTNKFDVKWYMKCFIYWTAALKSSKLWSSQLWTQFKQFHIEAWLFITAMIIAYLISNPQFNIWNISYTTSHPLFTGSLELTNDQHPTSVAS